MKKTLVDNSEYWKTVPAETIMGRNAFPGTELFEQLLPKAAVLDLGCGTGEMSEFLSEQGYGVTGIDINEEAINRNKARATRVRYLVGDITERLPFEDGAFEAVVSSFVLVNIIPLVERGCLVSELTRILKPGGIVWVNEGLVSDDYAQRYKLCKPFLGGDHDFFVFKEGTAPSSVKSSDELQQAIDEGKIVRVAHHFTLEELKCLFAEYQVLFEKESETSSPHSKSVIKMTVIVFKKKNTS